MYQWVFEMMIHYFYPRFLPWHLLQCLYVSVCPFISIIPFHPKRTKKRKNMFNIFKHYSYISQLPTTTINQFAVGLCLRWACVFKLYGLKISLSCRQNTQNQNITVYQIQFSLLDACKQTLWNLNFDVKILYFFA